METGCTGVFLAVVMPMSPTVVPRVRSSTIYWRSPPPRRSRRRSRRRSPRRITAPTSHHIHQFFVGCSEHCHIGIKEGNNFKGQHLCVKGVGVLEVFEPDLVDGFSEEFGGPTLRRLVAGIVVKAGFVGCFRSNANDHGGVVHDVTVIERQLDGAFERIAAMVGGVHHCIPQDGREGVDPPKLVVGDLHQDWEEHLPDQEEIVICWLPLNGGEAILRLLK